MIEEEARANNPAQSKFEQLATELGLTNESCEQGVSSSGEGEAPLLDRDAFLALEREFGAAAGAWAKKNYGWSQETVERGLAYLYEHRDVFDEIEDSQKRFYAAYGMLEELAKFDRIEARLRAKAK